MIKLINQFQSLAQKSGDISLFLLRILLAYGFWEPAKMKWDDIQSVADWFESLGIFAPKLNAYMAASTEMLGVFLLALGLGSRFIAIPLIVVMLVAIKTVHWENGFLASDNGFEIPLYYLSMLLILFSFGSGKLSLDFVIQKIKK
ncbi:MAG: DoxX family protein [Sphingobacteriaceae bacterium]|nr:DoxX family protein [Sphingobacteriaceae bacterium]